MKITLRLRSSTTWSAFALSLFVLTSCDIYPESGKWQGEVSISNEQGRETHRCPIELSLTRTSEVVLVRSLDLHCNDAFRYLRWSPEAFTRRGTDLFKDGRKAGAIYPDGTVKLDLRDPDLHDAYPIHAERLVITWSRLGDVLYFSLREESYRRYRTMEGSLSVAH